MTINIEQRVIEGNQRIYLRTNEIDRIDKMLHDEYKRGDHVLVEWEEAVESVIESPALGRRREKEVDITHEWSRLARLFRALNIVEFAILLELLAFEIFGEGDGGGGTTNPPPSSEPVAGWVNFTVPKKK